MNLVFCLYHAQVSDWLQFSIFINSLVILCFILYMDLFLLLWVCSFIFRPQTLIIQLSCSYDRVSLKRTVCIPGIALVVKHLLYWYYRLKMPLAFYEGNAKIKDTKQLGGEGKSLLWRWQHCHDKHTTTDFAVVIVLASAMCLCVVWI